MTEHAAEIINDAAARVERKLAAPKPSRVISDQPTWLELQRTSGGLTPSSVSARLFEADQGRMGQLVDLTNALRQKDAHLQGILETRETAVQRLPWILELPKKPTKLEKKAAQFVEDCIRPGLGGVIAQSSSAPLFGYGVTEAVMRKSSGYIVPDYYAPVLHRRFIMRGSTLLWQDRQGQSAVDIRADYPGQFIISRPRVNGDSACREGLMRPLVWAALFRNWTLTDWLRLGEIAWRPWRTGSYKASEFRGQEDVDGLVSILDGMATSGVAVVPDTVTLDVQWPQGAANGKGPHSEMYVTMSKEMSKAVLGQTETTEASTSSGYAQSKTQNEVRKDKVESDATFIGADITRDHVAYLVLWNFGPNVRPPKLKAVTEDTVDIEAFGKGVGSLSKAGLRMPAKWARDKAGIPDPVDGEETIGGVVAPPEDPKGKPAGPDNAPAGADEA